MKHTIEKLTEYGLSIELEPNEFSEFQQRLVDRNKEESLLPYELCDVLDIFIEDVELFKLRFSVSNKYNVFTKKVLKSICIDSNGEGAMDFYNPEYMVRVVDLLKKLVIENEEEFLKQNKKFKVKKTFLGAGAIDWLANELFDLYKSLLTDPDTLPARQQLYADLVTSLSKDLKEFKSSQNH